ncbi:hypothetical protein CYLTODRAFT_487468 [Cylindrobasidium torrendii FP15055 ss-10]|uniref:Uncharacterized protein n=1 Tax=Cylindrobasidium torrendii FP15055 ss-10 TaxID=1314674 RepID=A0A0D7BNC7_9AGAR|nr:hypothetical protein CYLTODRAFT_487468 [Cylindrobasidium torrendii FP15055 ss-10]
MVGKRPLSLSPLSSEGEGPSKRQKNGETEFAALLRDNSKEKADHKAWLTELRDMVLGMSDADRAEAKRLAGGDLWAQFVHLNVTMRQDGTPRALKGQCIRGTVIREWDMVPVARPVTCKTCAFLKRTCEYTNSSNPNARCRECLFKQSECVVYNAAPKKVAPLPETIATIIQDDPGTHTEAWLKELRHRILQLDSDEQAAVKSGLPRQLWAELVHLALPPNKDGKRRNITPIINKIATWDIVPQLMPIPCQSCYTKSVECESMCAAEPSKQCRRCAFTTTASANDCCPVDTGDTPAPTQAQEHADHALYVELVAVHNDKEKKDGDKIKWLQELRDHVLQMTPSKQLEVRGRLGDKRWAQIVGLSIPNHILKKIARDVDKMAGWSVDPVKAGVPCECCKAAKTTCEYTSQKNISGPCRECDVAGTECVRRPPSASDILTDDDLLKEAYAIHSRLPKQGLDRTNEVQALRQVAAQISSTKQGELKASIGDEVWAEMVWSAKPVKGKSLEGTAVNKISVVDWALSPLPATPPCRRCLAEKLDCVHTNGKKSNCRECAVLGETCDWEIDTEVHTSQSSVFEELARPPSKNHLPKEANSNGSGKEHHDFFELVENEGSDHQEWITELRDLAAGMDSEQQAAARQKAGDSIWAQMVAVSVNDKRPLQDGKIGGSKITEWDLVPVVNESSCDYCVNMSIACERQRDGPAGTCRACSLKRRGCTRTSGATELSRSPTTSRKPAKKVQPVARPVEEVIAGPSTRRAATIVSENMDWTFAEPPSPPPRATVPPPRVVTRPREVSPPRTNTNVSVSAPLVQETPSISSISAIPTTQVLTAISKSELRLLDRLEKELDRKDLELERREQELHAMRVERVEREKQMRTERETLLKEVERVRTERDEERAGLMREVERLKGLGPR